MQIVIMNNENGDFRHALTVDAKDKVCQECHYAMDLNIGENKNRDPLTIEWKCKCGTESIKLNRDNIV